MSTKVTLAVESINELKGTVENVVFEELLYLILIILKSQCSARQKSRK